MADWDGFDASADQKPSGKRGLVAAIVALVAVIAVGFAAYGLLANQVKTQDAASAGTAAMQSSADGSVEAASPSAESPNASNAQSGDVQGSDGNAGGQASADAAASAGAGEADGTLESAGGANAAGSATAPQLANYDATVYTLDEKPLALTEIAAGKPLVINYWATWCPYCVQEMGDFQAIYNDYKDRVSFAFIDCVDGVREKPQDGADWLKGNGYDLPCYYDTTMEAQYTFAVTALPTTVVVAADGSIVSSTPGSIDASRMRAALDALV